MAESTRSTNIAKKKKIFLELFLTKTGNISELCKSVGINRTTYYNWLKRDEKFAENIKNEEEALIDFAESKLMIMINEKNPAAVIFFLKTKGKRRGYIESAEHIHSGGMILEMSDKFLPKIQDKKKNGKAEPE